MNKMAPIPDPSHGLTRENMLAAFPVALREDTSIAALADAVAGVLAERREEIDRLRIYSAVDQLEEPLLDILAHDFKVDWWNPNYSLAEKRRSPQDLGDKGCGSDSGCRSLPRRPGAGMVRVWRPASLFQAAPGHTSKYRGKATDPVRS